MVERACQRNGVSGSIAREGRKGVMVTELKRSTVEPIETYSARPDV